MNILFATSEAVPFAKTGGLADVCGSLPLALSKWGHQAAVIMPAYRCTKDAVSNIRETGIQFNIRIGAKAVPGRLLESCLPGSNVPVYLVEQDQYFDRPELYRAAGHDYPDNCERFIFFCRAVLDAAGQLPHVPEILHCHDWQTGLIPAYLKVEHRPLSGSPLAHTASVMTIHNLAYQGQFWHWDMLLTGLDWKYFNWHQMEFYGKLNLLKTGLVFADSLTTVSKRYAQEIQTVEHGCGLEGVLQYRQADLTGILNGVDYAEWNPATDAALAANYREDTVTVGKAQCKAALQRELGLEENPHLPLVGFVGRLADQKGLDLIAKVMGDWANSRSVQWAILGTGEPHYHEQLPALAASHPERVAVKISFSDRLARRIEAGADMFVMPSRYEPCGLSQLYSLKYGTVPIVRSVGGLADTITHPTRETLSAGTANGFAFQAYSAEALASVLAEACDTYHNRPDVWQTLIQNGMRQDWSWDRSAKEYLSWYEQTLARAMFAAKV